MDLFEMSPTFEDPLGMLRACHRRIERALDALQLLVEREQQEGLGEGARESLRQILHYFATGVPRHAKDEEESLFPRMRFAFLEGGVAWGCSVFADLISHWDKRNGNVIQKLNPANLDRVKIGALVREYGGAQMYSRWSEFEAEMNRGMGSALPENLDDFAACNITKKEDIYNLFVPNFFFGCESDDPTLNYAFAAKINPFGAKLGAILSSDISHFDVPDMTEVLEEAWELVEEKGMPEEDFQAFTFGNAVKLWASLNPDFFKGTVVESQVRKLQV